uniref:Uncharacterized protein n=1 Tax=Amphimedon queenslandica TaxID=400682 RepID=A0A1X7TPF9_AMPQE
LGIQKSHVETNQYQDIHELRKEVPITTSPVTSTNNRPIDNESPYHVDINQELMQQQRTTTQKDRTSPIASNLHATTVYANDAIVDDTYVISAERTDSTNPATDVKPKANQHVNNRKGCAKFTSNDEELKVEAPVCSKEDVEKEKQ